MPMTSSEMLKYLKKNGFIMISQNGSHVKMRNPCTQKAVIVPCHARDLKKGMEQAILKQAGLK
ncbi:MAG: type II toxin-antitoxin system HicA family toxin [Lachnospiraceae bacterium]|nr:type II toxin-antitoxin system HicA family toxin [Lachnospiraceae bacterium]